MYGKLLNVPGKLFVIAAYLSTQMKRNKAEEKLKFLTGHNE